jgi:hypothetical protein
VKNSFVNNHAENAGFPQEHLKCVDLQMRRVMAQMVVNES